MGFVPVIGDGIKAAARGTEAVGTLRNLERALSAAQDTVNAARRVANSGIDALRGAARSSGALNAIRRQAARRYWAAQREAQRRRLQREFADCPDAACRRRKQQEIADLHNNPYGGGRLPSAERGTWRGQPGHGTFVPDPGTPMADAIVQYNQKHGTNLEGVRFDRGFPDFSDYTAHQVEIPNMRGDNIDGRRTGELGDFGQARQAMAEQTGGRWTTSMEDNLTWHHNQDGVTMQLVDQDVHAAVAHQGGASMMRDTETF